MIISADNVNLTGFTITGSGKEWRYVNPEKTSLRYDYCGIIVSGKNNIISYNIIIDNGVGLKVKNVCLIVNNLIADNYDDGVCLSGDAHGTHIVNNIITSNGIDEEANQADGIGVENVPSIEILNNTISENQVDGIWSDTSDGMKIIGNTIYGNKNDGINLLEGSSCNISKNKIYNHITGGFFIQPFSSGINLRRGRKNIISHNYIYDNNFGISYQVVMSDEIYQNSITDNTCGIWISTSTLINIHDNDMRNNRLTIGLWCSNALEVHKNNLISSRTLVLFTWYSTSNFMNNYWGAPSPLFRTLRLPHRIITKTVLLRPASFYEFIIDVDN